MPDGLPVRPGLDIPRDELTVRATRGGGPGGQHVNKVATRVEVVWCVRDSRVLRDDERARLLEKLASRLDADGCLRVVAADTRSQAQNRESAERRLAELVRKALAVPKPRRATKPTREARERRLAEKKRRGETKRLRRELGE